MCQLLVTATTEDTKMPLCHHIPCRTKDHILWMLQTPNSWTKTLCSSCHTWNHMLNTKYGVTMFLLNSHNEGISFLKPFPKTTKGGYFFKCSGNYWRLQESFSPPTCNFRFREMDALFWHQACMQYIDTYANKTHTMIKVKQNNLKTYSLGDNKVIYWKL